jgi:hypothetical protein
MTLRKLTIVPMLAMALFAAGCGADCEGLCEDGKECEGADEDFDCEGFCEKQEKLAEDAGCEDEYDETISCAGDQDDVCERDEDTCSSESEKYGDCLTDYCMDNQEQCLDAIGA